MAPAGPARAGEPRAVGAGRPRDAPGAAADDFRALMSAFPTGVAVVTTVDRDGNPRGMTCSALASVTLRPPTLLVCLNVHSGTLAASMALRRFAVNLLHSRARPAAELFSSPVADRFTRIRWRPAADGLPWLFEDSFAFAGCSVARIIFSGDHAVVLGEVTQITAYADVPLLYGMREFSAWPSR